eukprot:6458350-Amphidinium_carterae.1
MGTCASRRAQTGPGVRCCAFMLCLTLAVQQFGAWLSPNRENVGSDVPVSSAPQVTSTGTRAWGPAIRAAVARTGAGASIRARPCTGVRNGAFIQGMTLAGLQSGAVLSPGRSSITCSVPGENPAQESGTCQGTRSGGAAVRVAFARTGTGVGVRARVCPGVRGCAFILWVSLAVLQIRTWLSSGQQSVARNCPGRDATQEPGTVQGTLA